MIPETHPWSQLKLEFKENNNNDIKFNNDEPKLIRKRTTNNCYSKPKLNYEPNHYYKFEDIEEENCNCIIN